MVIRRNVKISSLSRMCEDALKATTETYVEAVVAGRKAKYHTEVEGTPTSSPKQNEIVPELYSPPSKSSETLK